MNQRTVFCFALATAAAIAMADTVLYSGQPIASTGITLTSWGGGKIEEARDVSLAGGAALKLLTTNLFQGGLISFANPIDLSSAGSSKENVLAIGVWIASSSSAPAGGGGGGGGIGPSPAGGGGKGGGVSVGGGFESGPPQGGGDSARTAPVMTKVRMVIKTSDGKLSEAIIPVSGSGKWIRTGIPVAMIPGFSKTNKMVSAIAVSGDAPAYFYVGEIRVLADQTPIQGYLLTGEQNLGRGTEITLSGAAESGFCPVEFVWDFNDKDGLQDDSIGQTVSHKFRIPGEFNVTLTIRDLYGVKKPWRGTVKVVVNP
jgi:hypothetical protein